MERIFPIVRPWRKLGLMGNVDFGLNAGCKVSDLRLRRLIFPKCAHSDEVLET